MVSRESKTKVALGVGLGLAAAAAAAGAGYYFYASPKGGAHRKKAAKWANDLKADVLKKAKKLQKFDERAFKVIVDESAKAYERLKSIDENDVRAAAAELKENWQHVEKELSRVAKKSGTTVKKAAKVVKKSAKAAKKAVPAKKKKVATKKRK